LDFKERKMTEETKIAPQKEDSVMKVTSLKKISCSISSNTHTQHLMLVDSNKDVQEEAAAKGNTFSILLG
jgi:hypothetical protein